MEGLEWSATIRGSMRPLLVVIETEGIELDLQVGNIFGRGLSLQIALEGLMEALDLAAGLRVVWSRVF